MADLLPIDRPLDSPLDYLVISAHPDDAELGVGGAILSLKAGGARVGILDLTSGEPTPHGSLEIRARETAAATAVLGLDWRGNLGLTNRSLVADLDARRKLASVIRLLRPRVLLAHFWQDAHPDHVAASALVDAARFWSKLTKTDMPGEPFFPDRIVYYFSVHLRLHIQPSFVLDVSPHFEKKLEAVACYHSQFVQGRAVNAIAEQLRTAASYWGWTIGVRYGEPLRTREEVGLADLRALR
jgi:N-acetylglucosamine malate deacetylase 1